MNTATEPNIQQPVKGQPSCRWIGAVMFVAGGGLAYFSIRLPLLAASEHEEEVSIMLKGVGLVPALLAFGFILFWMGNEKAGQLFGTRRKPTAIGLVICLIVAVTGILLYEWLESRLRAYGYKV